MRAQFGLGPENKFSSTKVLDYIDPTGRDEDKSQDQKSLKTVIETGLGRGRTLTQNTVAAWLRTRIEAPVYVDDDVLVLRREGGADKPGEKTKKTKRVRLFWVTQLGQKNSPN